MGLARELFPAEFKERDDFGSEALGHPEPLGIEHHLSNGLSVRGDHGDGAEQLFEVVWEVGPASITWVHGDEDASRHVEGIDTLSGAQID